MDCGGVWLAQLLPASSLQLWRDIRANPIICEKSVRVDKDQCRTAIRASANPSFRDCGEVRDSAYRVRCGQVSQLTCKAGTSLVQEQSLECAVAASCARMKLWRTASWRARTLTSRSAPVQSARRDLLSGLGIPSKGSASNKSSQLTKQPRRPLRPTAHPTREYPCPRRRSPISTRTLCSLINCPTLNLQPTPSQHLWTTAIPPPAALSPLWSAADCPFPWLTADVCPQRQPVRDIVVP